MVRVPGEPWYDRPRDAKDDGFRETGAAVIARGKLAVGTYGPHAEGQIDRPWWVVPLAILLCAAMTILFLVGAGLAAGTLGFILMIGTDRTAAGAGDVMAALGLLVLLLTTLGLAIGCTMALDSLFDPRRWCDHNLQRGRCPRCKYDIRNLPDQRCPECGFVWGSGRSRRTR
jgi:hypothetical protein